MGASGTGTNATIAQNDRQRAPVEAGLRRERLEIE
jgi:hypothetical protein